MFRSALKKIRQTLDNRYTDVVSLQRKIHESTNTSLTTKNTQNYGKKRNLLRNPRINPLDKEGEKTESTKNIRHGQIE